MECIIAIEMDKLTAYFLTEGNGDATGLFKIVIYDINSDGIILLIAAQ